MKRPMSKHIRVHDRYRCLQCVTNEQHSTPNCMRCGQTGHPFWRCRKLVAMAHEVGWQLPVPKEKDEEKGNEWWRDKNNPFKSLREKLEKKTNSDDEETFV